MTIKIRGFELPPLLEKLINDGVWKERRKLVVPEEMLTQAGLTLELEVWLIGEETVAHSNDDQAWFGDFNDESWKGIQFLLPYDSSKRKGYPISDLTKLDIDNAILIAWDIGDDVICLDYRSNPPRVVCIDWHNRQIVALAPDFETFAKGVGLVE